MLCRNECQLEIFRRSNSFIEHDEGGDAIYKNIFEGFESIKFQLKSCCNYLCKDVNGLSGRFISRGIKSSFCHFHLGINLNLEEKYFMKTFVQQKFSYVQIKTLYANAVEVVLSAPNTCPEINYHLSYTVIDLIGDRLVNIAYRNPVPVL